LKKKTEKKKISSHFLGRALTKTQLSPGIQGLTVTEIGEELNKESYEVKKTHIQRWGTYLDSPAETFQQSY
jgi:hypothetical protein